MKKLIYVMLMMAFASYAFAASTIVAASGTRGGIFFESPDGAMLILKLTCTSHTDGSFTANTALTSSVITEKTKFGTYYYQTGFYLAHAWVVNDGTSYPDTAGTVTIADETGQQIIGATVGDTLTLATTASGKAYLSSSRSTAQRQCSSRYDITVSDTQSGAATSIFSLYLVFVK